MREFDENSYENSYEKEQQDNKDEKGWKEFRASDDISPDSISTEEIAEDEITVEAEDVTMEEPDQNSGRYRYQPNGRDSRHSKEHWKVAKDRQNGTLKKIGKIVGAAALFGLISGGIICGALVAKDKFYPTNFSRIETTDAKVEAGAADGGNTGVTAMDVSTVVENVMPSVVSITCTVQNTNYFYGTQESQGAGSGFIIAKNNNKLYIATNNHVVSGATALTVGFADGTTSAAQIVGVDTDADLAVISVDEKEVSEETASKIKIAVLGESDQLKVGEPVIAIGNALGYGQSVTTGVLSAKDREVSFTDGTLVLLQTDAAINPGNSGGVLINQKGQVIGINNAKLADTEVEGMGYAIPITTAKTILNDLMNHTTVKEGEEAFLGVVGKNIDASYSQALGMPSGIYVSQVVTGSPAETAGISAGDIITAIDGNNVSTMTGLKDKLARKSSGTKVKITLKRANQNGTYEEQTVNVTLGKKSDFEDTTTENSAQQPESQQDGNTYGNGDNNSNNNNNNGNYIDPFEFFFGNGGGNGYYYYNR